MFPKKLAKPAQKQIQKAKSAITYASAGELIGWIVAQFIPDSVLPDFLIAQAFAGIFAVVGVIASYSKYKTNSGRSLHDCYADADQMFLDHFISESERLKMREHCFELYLKSK